MSRLLAPVGIAIAVVLLLPIGFVVLIAATSSSAGAADDLCAPAGAGSAPASAGTGWSAEQTDNARVIVEVGAARKVPRYGWVIAVATAMQESTLRNLGHLGADNDHDSLGLFQQRPSQGWGTPAQILQPRYAAGKFYDRLLTVNGWQRMPLTAAAQAVQRSAYPDAYAKWSDDAEKLVTAVGAGLGGSCLNPCPTAAPGSTPTGGCADTAVIFARATTWLTAWSGGPVPYLSSGNPRDWYQGYRRDCSGYVSMALGLKGPGLNTSGLAAKSTVITKQALRPGDLLINTAPNLRGHVVLFERWADASMTRYYGYEQTGSADTVHRTIPYPYFGDYPMLPYRFGT